MRLEPSSRPLLSTRQRGLGERPKTGEGVFAALVVNVDRDRAGEIRHPFNVGDFLQRAQRRYADGRECCAAELTFGGSPAALSVLRDLRRLRSLRRDLAAVGAPGFSVWRQRRLRIASTKLPSQQSALSTIRGRSHRLSPLEVERSVVTRQRQLATVPRQHGQLLVGGCGAASGRFLGNEEPLLGRNFDHSSSG